MTTRNPEPEPKRETGKVKWFNFDRGYGFITSDSSREDVFVHRTGISEEDYKSLKGGDRVEYTVVQEAKGPKAVDVIILPEK
jgi:CspA family cold shock protein